VGYSVTTATNSGLSEAELSRRASNGDVDAFGEMYALHRDTIYRYVYYRTGHVAEAEDLTEQTFLKAWEAMERYEHQECGFTGWLYRIAHNLVADHYRTRKETVSIEELLPSLELEGKELAPEELLTYQEDLQQLQAAIAQLPDEQQQVVILRFVEGISHAEVASIIGKSEGNSRVVQYRALATLQGLLSEGM
jgi:RNA polymerase sigma-70 factor (ECF subfamily)